MDREDGVKLARFLRVGDDWTDRGKRRSRFAKLFLPSDAAPHPSELPPPSVSWMEMPSLTVAVFGSVERTPDLQRIQTAYASLAKRELPAIDEQCAKDNANVDEYYSRLVREKLAVTSVPIPEVGRTDRVSRLLNVNPAGKIWLLVDEGASITDADAALVPAVLTEFAIHSQCALVQGKGHHLFVRPELIHLAGRSVGPYHPDAPAIAYHPLWEHAAASNLVCKRIRYITIHAEGKIDSQCF